LNRTNAKKPRLRAGFSGFCRVRRVQAGRAVGE
jgi:hypothetical protein